MAPTLSLSLCLLRAVRRCALETEVRILQVLGLHPPPTPALVVQAPTCIPWEEGSAANTEDPSFLDSIFWMAAPKSRRTIEVNRTRRRAPEKLEKLKDSSEKRGGQSERRTEYVKPRQDSQRSDQYRCLP
ncbi:large ribosomal subunit protein bL32m isoform X2 [Pleurodeles waltl]|uniref:large ribosomal subunit protein bL32m isoform X2 n=1 Tax=Pleurodeles waltl TaxID=8319 RepID=UPI003709BB97